MNKTQVSSLLAYGQRTSAELAAAPVETMLSVLAFLERAPFRRESARTRELLIDLLLEHRYYDGALQHIGELARANAATPASDEITRACSVPPPAWDPPDPLPEYEELDELDLEPVE